MRGAWAWGMPIAMALGALLGCGRTPARGPEWVAHVPATCEAAVSIHAGWALDQPQFRAVLDRYPEADQALELVLKKARISPQQESGRITFFALGKGGGSGFLLRFGGFRDPQALAAALAQAFPREGSLETRGRAHPLLVVLDVGQHHFRAVQDADQALWVGELEPLTALLNAQDRPETSLQRAAEWIDADAPLQVFLRPQRLLERMKVEGTGPGFPGRDLRIPEGIRTLLWTVKPVPGPAYRMELVLAGEPAAISQVVPWLEKFVAVAASVGEPAHGAPELSQARDRAGLRCQLSQAQFEAVLDRLGMPLRGGRGEKAP